MFQKLYSVKNIKQLIYLLLVFTRYIWMKSVYVCILENI